MKSVRNWSNDELRKFSDSLYGEVINISGWKDEDKEGGYYREYFPKSSKYYLSNYGNDKIRGISEDIRTDFTIDLENEIDKTLQNRFDVVFHHTILEHVKDPSFVFENLSSMSKNILISVVPFKQKLHFGSGSYGDYFRFSPMAMRNLYEDNGFKILYESFSPPPFIDIYLFYIGYKSDEWGKGRNKTMLNLEKLNQVMGANKWKILLYNIFYNIWNKILILLGLKQKNV